MRLRDQALSFFLMGLHLDRNRVGRDQHGELRQVIGAFGLSGGGAAVGRQIDDFGGA